MSDVNFENNKSFAYSHLVMSFLYLLLLATYAV